MFTITCNDKERHGLVWNLLSPRTSARKTLEGVCPMLRVASNILLVAAVALLLMAPAACKADGISENFTEVTPALNAS